MPVGRNPVSSALVADVHGLRAWWPILTAPVALKAMTTALYATCVKDFSPQQPLLPVCQRAPEDRAVRVELYGHRAAM